MKTSLNKNPKLSASELKQKLKCLRSIPVMTIQDVLCRVMGLRSQHAAKKPFLSDAMKQKRLAFARLHVNKSEKWWRSVLFTDESNFQLFSSSRFQRVRRAKGTNRFDEKFTVKTVKHGGHVMVWGSFSWHGSGEIFFLPKGQTMNAEKYLEVLKKKAAPAMKKAGTKWFLQDGAPCHNAKKVKTWLQQKGWHLVDWPGNSPDLNPIENLWSCMKMELKNIHSSNLDRLRQEIRRVWRQKMTLELCQNLVSSMPRRLAAVIAADGALTKY